MRTSTTSTIPRVRPIAFERAQVAALLGEARAYLDDLDRALARLDAGVYSTLRTLRRADQRRAVWRPDRRLARASTAPRHRPDWCPERTPGESGGRPRGELHRGAVARALAVHPTDRHRGRPACECSRALVRSWADEIVVPLIDTMVSPGPDPGVVGRAARLARRAT